jgi:hypothetical protein
MVKVNERKHPSYLENIGDWEFYWKSFNGGKEYVNEYLYSHRLENAEDYIGRIARSFYLNYCAPISSIAGDFIFRKEVTRPADLKLSDFRENVNRRGANIHSFMRKVCTLSSVYGHIHILMDRPRPPSGIENIINNGQTTKADNLLTLPPYVTIIHPQNLVDWSVDSASKELNWIIVAEEIYNDEDYREEREVQNIYKVWTKNEWIIYDAEDNLIDSGKHQLGFVPLITCYHKDIDEDMIGESMLKDVAEANRIVFNWTSNIDEMIARQTFSQLICPDDGTLFQDEIDERGKSGALKKIGSASIFTFPADSRHAPAFISPDTGQVTSIWTMVENLVREMFRMAGLISAKSSLVQLQQRTGKAQQYEFLDMDAFLAAKAKALEETENKIDNLYYKWMGIKDMPSRVHYPEKFDIITPQEIVDLFTKVTLSAISGTLNKEMAKRMVHQVLPHAEDEIVERIYEEIENNEYLENPELMMQQAQQAPVLGKSSQEEVTDTQEEDQKPSTDENTPKKERIPNEKNPQRRAKWRSAHSD